MLVDPFRDLTADDAAPWLERRLRSVRPTRPDPGPPGVHAQVHRLAARASPREGLPGGEFVHVLRDGAQRGQTPTCRFASGRATGASRAGTFGNLSAEEQRDWEATNYSWPYLGGLEWKRLMAAFEVARDEIGPERWIDLRYEDLVARPAEETTTVLRFAGLDCWSGLSASTLAALRVSAGRTDAYRDELRPADVAPLEAALATTLERWGYSVSGS